MLEYFNRFYIHLEFGKAYILTELIFVFGTALLLNKITLSKKWLRETVVQAAGLWIFLVFSCSILYMLTDKIYNRQAIYPLALALYAIFVSKYSVSSRIVMTATYYATFLLSLSLSEAISYKAGSKAGATIAIIGVFVICLILFYKHFSIEKFRFIPFTCAALAVMLALIACLVEFLSSLTVFNVTREYRILVAGSFLLAEICSYYLFYRISLEYDENLTLHVMQKRTEDELEFMRLSERNLEDLKVIRHEIKNQYAYMKLLIENKQYEKTAEFFADFEKNILPSLSLVDSGNNTVNTVINLEMIKAKNARTNLNTNCIVPQELPIDDIDLTSVLTNLIDNAIEFCQTKQTEGAIDVYVAQKNSYLFVKVTNPVPPDTNREKLLQLKTHKKNPSLHGYGTRIVSKIAQKYNGCVRYDMRDEKFIADVMLALADEAS